MFTQPPKKGGRKNRRAKQRKGIGLNTLPASLQAALRCSLGSALCVLRVVVQLLLPHALPCLAGREEEAHPNI